MIIQFTTRSPYTVYRRMELKTGENPFPNIPTRLYLKQIKIKSANNISSYAIVPN